jgi:hypothetical protein
MHTPGDLPYARPHSGVSEHQQSETFVQTWQLPALSLCIKQTTISCLERHSDLLHNSATNIGGLFIDGLFKDVLKEAVVAWCKVLTVAWKN